MKRRIGLIKTVVRFLVGLHLQKAVGTMTIYELIENNWVPKEALRKLGLLKVDESSGEEKDYIFLAYVLCTTSF